jgi:hypothetical protein
MIAPSPQEPTSPFGDATISPEGKVSVKATLVRPAAPFGLMTEKVRLVLPFNEMLGTPKVLVMLGGATTWPMPTPFSGIPTGTALKSLVTLTAPDRAQPFRRRGP